MLLLIRFVEILSGIDNGRLVLERAEYVEHVRALVVGHLLGVARVRHGFHVVVLELDRAQQTVRHVFHEYPFYLRFAKKTNKLIN